MDPTTTLCIVTPKRIAKRQHTPIGGVSCSEFHGYERDVDLLCKDYGLIDFRPSWDGSWVAYFKDGRQERIDKSDADRFKLLWDEQMGYNRATYKGGGIRS